MSTLPLSPAVLGLDVQPTRLGWGLADLDTGAPVACGLLGLDDARARTVRQALLTIGAHPLLGDGPALVYVEGPYVGPNRMGSLRHAMVIGQVVQACDRRWPNAPVEVIPVSDWKRACELRGNATKAEVLACALELGYEPTSQDAADAACIAYAGWRRNTELVAAAERRW